MKIDVGKHFGQRECPGCAMDVSANENRCPICGYEFPNQSISRKHLTWAVALLMLTLFLWLVAR